MIEQITTLYLFVIDTDSYTGNFEREMCAYITGAVGDCGVGAEMADIARREVPDVVGECASLVELVADEYGCCRPVAIYPNPLYGNDGHGGQALLTEANREQYPYPAYNSVAIYFHTMPADDLIEIMQERAKAIVAKGIYDRCYPTRRYAITITGFR